MPTQNVSKKTISALQQLPFENIIGGPLNACVLAQKEAALTTIGFINDVGLQTVYDKDDKDTGKKEAIYVYFTFVQNGRKVNISVPLLTIVPIPYIAINTIDINFKANISGVETTSDTDESSYESTEESESQKKRGFIFKKKTSSFKSSISTKRDSKSTQESSYSIEATVDVAVHATQDSMPAGMAKVLEMLGSAIDLCNPEGELTVSATTAVTGDTIVFTYKGSDGVYHPDCITTGDSAFDAELKTTADGISKSLTIKNNSTIKTITIGVANIDKYDLTDQIEGVTVTLNPKN